MEYKQLANNYLLGSSNIVDKDELIKKNKEVELMVEIMIKTKDRYDYLSDLFEKKQSYREYIEDLYQKMVNYSYQNYLPFFKHSDSLEMWLKLNNVNSSEIDSIEQEIESLKEYWENNLPGYIEDCIDSNGLYEEKIFTKKSAIEKEPKMGDNFEQLI